MKKCISLILTLVLLLSLSLTAHADVIWEPHGDSFYTSHRDEFSYCGYYVYANSPEGITQTYKKPGGSKGNTIENGTLLYLQHSYEDKDGQLWGLLDEQVYVPMTHLLNRYDHEFFDDHPEIVSTSNVNAEIPDISVDIPKDTAILTWTYPGGVYTESKNYWDENILSGCVSFYTDDTGLVWGYIGYWYGHQNSWVCLSDYHNPDLAEPEIYLGETYWGDNAPINTEQPAADEAGLNWLYIAMPVGAVVVAAALILLWPKKKAEKEN